MIEYMCIYIYIYIAIYIYIYTRVDLSHYSDRVKWSSRLVFVSIANGQHVLSLFFSSTFSIDGRTRRSRGLCWRSWAALGAYVGGLGPLLGPMLAVLGPMLAVLGRSWGLCGRSWAAPGAHVGGLGSGSGPKLAVLGPKWSVLEAIRAKSGPNPSGKAIWQADQGRKVAQTLAGKAFWGGDGNGVFSGTGCPYRFFL